jgi:acyl carrier protein
MTSVEETDSHVRTLLAEYFGVGPREITPGLRLCEDLEAESLDIAEVVMLMEDAFKFTASDEDAEMVVSIQDVVDLVMKKTAN